MTKKQILMEKLESINFGNDFLEQVGSTWIEHLEDEDLDDIIYEVKSVIEYGANNGNVNFVIYTKDNENFIKDNLFEAFDYINEIQQEIGVSIEISVDEIMYMAVRDCANRIENEISFDIEDYEDEENEVIEILQ